MVIHGQRTYLANVKRSTYFHFQLTFYVSMTLTRHLRNGKKLGVEKKEVKTLSLKLQF